MPVDVASQASVLVVGSVNRDLLLSVPNLPAPGETVLSTGATWGHGGKGANQATAAAAAGARAMLVGAVGTDQRGAELLEGLVASGIDTSRMVRIPGDSGLAVVLVDEGGDNSIVVVPGSNAALRPEHIDGIGDLLDQADVVLLQGEVPPDTIASVLRRAKDSRAMTLLNLAPVVPLDRDVLALADMLAVNVNEATQLLAQLRHDHDGGADPARALATILGVTVIVTMGPAGASVATATTHTYVPTEPVDDVVDTTGAGDAFVGAVAAQLAAGGDLISAIRAGNAAGGAVVRSAGARHRLTT